MENNDGSKADQNPAGGIPDKSKVFLHVEFEAPGSAQFTFNMAGISPGQLHALVGYMTEFAAILTQQMIVDSMNRNNMGGIVLPGGGRMPPGMRPR